MDVAAAAPGGGGAASHTVRAQYAQTGTIKSVGRNVRVKETRCYCYILFMNLHNAHHERIRLSYTRVPHPIRTVRARTEPAISRLGNTAPGGSLRSTLQQRRYSAHA